MMKKPSKEEGAFFKANHADMIEFLGLPVTATEKEVQNVFNRGLTNWISSTDAMPREARAKRQGLPPTASEKEIFAAATTLEQKQEYFDRLKMTHPERKEYRERDRSGNDKESRNAYNRSRSLSMGRLNNPNLVHTTTAEHAQIGKIFKEIEDFEAGKEKRKKLGFVSVAEDETVSSLEEKRKEGGSGKDNSPSKMKR